MTVDLKKWKQRNAAERVKAALTRPKRDNTRERLRRQFSMAATRAIAALNTKARHPWLKYGYNGDVVVTTKLGRHAVPVTGDDAIALRPADASAFLSDVIEATSGGQLDRQLRAAAGASSLKSLPAKPNNSEVVRSNEHSPDLVSPSEVRVRRPIEVGLMDER